MAKVEEKVDELENKVDRFESQMISLAKEVGETKGKVSALDDRVKHNCERNEQNFTLINSNLLEYITSTNELIAAIKDKAKDDITDLKVKNAKKLYVILAFIGLGILCFIGGSAIRWEKVDNYFEKTSASERAELIRQAIETASKVK